MVLPSASELEDIPGADFDIICKKSDNAVFKSHSFHLWMTCDYVKDLLDMDKKCRSIELDLTIEEVRDAMRFIYNLCRRFTTYREEIGRGYETRIPVRLYKIFRTLQVEPLSDLNLYYGATNSTFLLAFTKVNVESSARGMILKGLGWIDHEKVNCSDPDLAAAIRGRCVKMIATCITEWISTSRSWGYIGMQIDADDLPDFADSLLKTNVELLESIIKEYTIGDVNPKRNIDCYLWWLSFIEHYLERNGHGNDVYLRLMVNFPWAFFVDPKHQITFLTSGRRENNPEMTTLESAIRHDLLKGILKNGDVKCSRVKTEMIDGVKSVKLRIVSVFGCDCRVKLTFGGQEYKQLAKIHDEYPGLISSDPSLFIASPRM